MLLDNIADIYVSVDYEHNKKFMINSPLIVLSHKCIKFTSEGCPVVLCCCVLIFSEPPLQCHYLVTKSDWLRIK